MATTSSDMMSRTRENNTLGALGLPIATGITAAVVFVLCWLGTFIPFSSPTHAYIALITNADISSTLALAEGACWSLLAGALVGAVFAPIYDAPRFSRVARKAVR